MFKILFSLIFLTTFSAYSAERFYINIQGATSQIESVKKRSEYRMTKNVDFCRGVKMPKMVSNWKCQSGSKNTYCSVAYECVFVDKNFNRKSESLRTYRAMTALPAITAGYKIALSKSAKFGSKVAPVVASKQVVAKAAPKPTPVVKPTPAPSLAKQEQDDFDDLLKDMETPTETAQVEKKEESEDIFDEVASTEPEEKEEVAESSSSDSASTWDWLRLDGYINQMSDETGTQTALEAGWRPRWRFAARWNLEGRVGMSQRKSFASSEDAAFSVMEMGAWLGRRMGNWNLSGGFGRQSWGGEGTIGSQTPTFLSLGLAYYWSDIKFYAIEAIEFQYLSLSDEGSSSAMRFGFLIKF